MPIQVDVVSQEKMLFSEPAADMVLVPGIEGIMGILPNHTPLISLLDSGEVVIRKGSAEEPFLVFGGVVEIRPNKVVILADAADFAHEINLKEAEEARARALKLLQEGPPPEDQTLIAADLRRAELAIDIAHRTKSRAGGVRIKVMKDKPDEKSE